MLKVSTDQALQSVRIGRVEGNPPRRPWAVWDGARKLCEGMTRSEAVAMAAGIKWGETRNPLDLRCPLYRGAQWRHA